MSLANGRFIKHLWAVNQGAHFPHTNRSKWLKRLNFNGSFAEDTRQSYCDALSDQPLIRDAQT